MKPANFIILFLILLGLACTLYYTVAFKTIMENPDFDSGYLDRLLYSGQAIQLLLTGIILPAIGSICALVLFFKKRVIVYLLSALLGLALSLLAFCFLWGIN